METIPVWDAYGQEGECPLCILRDRAEGRYIDFFLGNSVMAPEMRVQVNRTGFCPRHFSLLLEGDNRLGLALMTHTHLLELTGKIKRRHRQLKQGADRILSTHGVLSVPKKADSLRRDVESAARFVDEVRESCLICERLTSTLERYAFTILYLWERDEDFKRALQTSRGFCLPHLGFVNTLATEVLSSGRLSEWLLAIMPVAEESLERLGEELHGFIQSFDYQRGDKDPQAGLDERSMGDALPRALQKITGVTMNGWKKNGRK